MNKTILSSLLCLGASLLFFYLEKNNLASTLAIISVLVFAWYFFERHLDKQKAKDDILSAQRVLDIKNKKFDKVEDFVLKNLDEKIANKYPRLDNEVDWAYAQRLFGIYAASQPTKAACLMFGIKKINQAPSEDRHFINQFLTSIRQKPRDQQWIEKVGNDFLKAFAKKYVKAVR